MKINKIIDWVSEEKLQKYQKNYNMISQSYFAYEQQDEIKRLEAYLHEIEDFNEFREDTLIKELVDNGYVICGDTHQVKAIPVFEDGYLVLSMRKWNEVMKKAFEMNHNRTYGDLGAGLYHNFYMASLSVDDEVLPRG